jgi:titin
LQASGNTLGGTKVALRDVVSGNGNQGVLIDDGASGNFVAGDYIGTDVTGANRLGNNNGGVVLLDAPANTIGGSASGAGDVISANGNDGVQVSSFNGGPGSLVALIQGNVIGLDASGIVGPGNGNNGVEVDYGAGTIIGGPASADRNVISGNQAGVYLQYAAVGVSVQGNYIGTDARGYKAIGNQFDGIVLGGSNNTVGGSASGAGNVISGNGRDGISDGPYSGSNGSNSIEGNVIGTGSTGTVPIPNRQDGVELAATGDVVGGTASAAGNVISGNAQFGLVLERNATAIAVQGNDIGTDRTGKLSLGNGSDGVHIQDAASVNTIGGSAPRAANVIAFNGGSGVAVTGGAVSDAILGNSIFANANQGIVLADNGNALQIAPVLSSAVRSGSAITVTGILSAYPQTTYRIQFFSNPTADPSGFGQGQVYLATKKVTTNSSGVASFSFTLNKSVAAGWVISTTATSPTGNTSAFSNDVTVTSASSASRGVVVPVGMVNTPASTATDLVLGALTSSSSDQDDVLTDLVIDRMPTRTRAVQSANPTSALGVPDRAKFRLRMGHHYGELDSCITPRPGWERQSEPSCIQQRFSDLRRIFL